MRQAFSLRTLDWGATFRLLIARWLAAGLVFFILVSIFGNAQSSAPSAGSVVGLFFSFVIVVPAALLCLAICGYAVASLSSALHLPIVPLAGMALFYLAGMLFILGDPIVYFMNRKWPDLFGNADLNFFNFVGVIFVHNLSPGELE